MISNEETRNFWNANARLQIPYLDRKLPDLPQSDLIAMPSTNRVPDVGELAISSPHARDRRGDDRLPVESEGGRVGHGGNPIERRPLTANEGSRGETVGDRLPVESEGGQAGRGGNPIEHPPIADGGNLLQRRGHGPHDAAGPSERNFVYTRTDLTLQGGVHIERAEFPPPFDAIHLISVIARRA